MLDKPDNEQTQGFTGNGVPENLVGIWERTPPVSPSLDLRSWERYQIVPPPELLVARSLCFLRQGSPIVLLQVYGGVTNGKESSSGAGSPKGK